LILDVAAETGIELPPLSPAQKAEIEAEIGFVTGDGNPLDAWGSGTFAANLPLALKLFDASPAHDVIAFVRDNFDDQPFDAPETARSYIDMFAAAARRSAKPHYLLTTRPGVMDRALVGVLREHGVATVGGFREGLMAGSTSQLIAFSAKADTYCPRPKPRSHSAMSTVLPPSRTSLTTIVRTGKPDFGVREELRQPAQRPGV
jgi:hypothetical protein